MPTNRVLYTLLDVKEMIAEKEKIKTSQIDFFNGLALLFEDDFGDGNIEVSDNAYIFQFDRD